MWESIRALLPSKKCEERDRKAILHSDNWEEIKSEKAKSLETLKSSFVEAASNEEALGAIEGAVFDFIENHGCSTSAILLSYEKIELPLDIHKKELSIRKELGKHYKNRDETYSKAFSVYLAFKHAELLLLHPQEDWKNFSGLQKLQTNLKSEEYFSALLIFILWFKNIFDGKDISIKIARDADRLFQLWNSQNLQYDAYVENRKSYERTVSSLEKHFLINQIAEYLSRRHKYNPMFREELVLWCEKDIPLYEECLTEFHDLSLFSDEEYLDFFENPELKAKRIKEIPFERVRQLKDYHVPHLPAFDILWGIYHEEENNEKAEWLKEVAAHIGYDCFVDE